ncbi:MAG: type II toxin-antitoxin system prevent-host-death family antitoxin [Halothiobacillus sp.]|nr:type II toxin-antitoxin system prevent-host-death family antitoxin [Halothiobacillus sp.]
MHTINMHEAKTHLSALVEEALRGEDVVIARAGKPLVRLVPVALAPKRVAGRMRGKIHLAPDFDETPQAVIDLFEQGE